MAAQEISKEQRSAWEKIYRTGWRQLYRHRALGIRKKDPCPLDDPKQMPLWWARNKCHQCPEKILTAARDAGARDVDLPPSQDRQSHPHRPLEPIDLAQFDLEEGQAVAFQRRLVASMQDRIAEEMLAGRRTDLLQQQHARAAKTLREMERDDRADRAQRDKFIPRDIVERDAATAADMLRQMHESMDRRVDELCSFLSAKHRQLVRANVRRVLSAQSRVFQRLHTYASPDQFLADLAAA
jgi:hypothetical protein